MKNFTFIPMVLAVAAAILTGGCSPGAKPAAGNPGVPVLVARSIETNVPVQIQPPPVGHVTPYSTVTVHSQIQGMISEVHFQEGQEVKKGDLLFTIDPRPAQAALAHDQAQLENAEIQFAREQKLFEQKLVSQDEYDTSKATRDSLAATVESDKLNLSYTEIRAPIDGVTGGLQSYAGNVVKAPDDTLLTINQIHPIYVAFAVPEQYLPEIRAEMRQHTLKAEASFQNMKGRSPQGELTFINNTVDETTGTILLKATFPNENDALWPGQFVSVSLTFSDLTNAVVVPAQAVQTGQNGEYIYAVKSDQTVEERPVTIGITYQDETVVQSGLAAGETVVTDGQLRLTPGARVTLKTADQSGPATSAAAP
ncbi:MAG TPA: efflux RND transporter periplasmic adaptor subunit [Verrucomicrobiae bacterium]|nr:efflux RND transporter periplasmic adaptor subunit [Verrucomicrobiae bacterium]